jgi:hypothetical protein
MNKVIFLFAIMLSGINPLVAQNDCEGRKDPSLFSRMPSHIIPGYTDNQFDKFEFKTGDGNSVARMIIRQQASVFEQVARCRG